MGQPFSSFIPVEIETNKKIFGKRVSKEFKFD